MSTEKNPESLLPKIARQRSSFQNTHTHTHTHTTPYDQVEHLHLKDTGREMQIPPTRLLFKIGICLGAVLQSDLRVLFPRLDVLQKTAE